MGGGATAVAQTAHGFGTLGGGMCIKVGTRGIHSAVDHSQQSVGAEHLHSGAHGIGGGIGGGALGLHGGKRGRSTSLHSRTQTYIHTDGIVIDMCLQGIYSKRGFYYIIDGYHFIQDFWR